MKIQPFLKAVLPLAAASAALAFQNTDAARWDREARNVTIVRDDWGIAHVHGKTDADAVFGMISPSTRRSHHSMLMNRNTDPIAHTTMPFRKD